MTPLIREQALVVRGHRLERQHAEKPRQISGWPRRLRRAAIDTAIHVDRRQHHFPAERITLTGAAAEILVRGVLALPARRRELTLVPRLTMLEDRVAARDLE